MKVGICRDSAPRNSHSCRGGGGGGGGGIVASRDSGAITITGAQ